MKKITWIQIDKRNGILGAVLGALAMLICFSWESGRILGIPFAAAFLVVGLLKLNIRDRRGIFALNLLWSLACVALTLCVSAATVDELLPVKLGAWKLLLNMAIIYGCIGVAFLITANWKASVTVVTTLLGILMVINSFIWRFRGKELMFVDFRSVGTALNVASQYQPFVSRMAYCFLFVLVLALFAQSCFPTLTVAAKGRARVGAALLSVALAVTVWLGGRDIISKTYYNEGTVYNGYCLNFLLGIRDSFVKMPETYSRETVQSLETEYPSEGQQSREELPNIIVIMNESFVDVGVLGSDPATSHPVMPFLDSLQEDTIRGYALTSVFGGNTANAEFELLTGHSLAFLPEGTVAFQQYVQDQLYSLPWLLKDLGYINVSTHPYSSTGWSRTTAYPAMGFDESSFDTDYKDPEYLRYYISDRAMVDHMIDRLEQQSEEPLFLYAVSMQNHGNYLYEGENYQQTLTLEGDFPAAEQYLDILRHSDMAMEQLLTYLSACGTDTVVLFFGDHFPHLEKQFYEQLHGGPFDTLEEQMLQYTVPFLIWANYDIPEQTLECTGMNYLSRYLLEAAGIELPAYYQFLKETEQVIPAMNAYGYHSVEKGGFIPFGEAEGREAQWLERYSVLQYNNIFDPGNRSDSFFGRYLPRE